MEQPRRVQGEDDSSIGEVDGRRTTFAEAAAAPSSPPAAASEGRNILSPDFFIPISKSTNAAVFSCYLSEDAQFFLPEPVFSGAESLPSPRTYEKVMLTTLLLVVSALESGAATTLPFNPVGTWLEGALRWMSTQWSA